jgi:hypothetical protein
MGCLIMQRKAQGVLASSVHIFALKLVYTTPPDVDLVEDERLSVLISIFRNTSGDEWRKQGPGVWPRIVAVLSKVEVLSESEERLGRAKKKEGDSAQSRARGDGKSGKRQRPDSCNDTGGKNIQRITLQKLDNSTVSLLQCAEASWSEASSYVDVRHTRFINHRGYGVRVSRHLI